MCERRLLAAVWVLWPCVSLAVFSCDARLSWNALQLVSPPLSCNCHSSHCCPLGFVSPCPRANSTHSQSLLLLPAYIQHTGPASCPACPHPAPPCKATAQAWVSWQTCPPACHRASPAPVAAQEAQQQLVLVLVLQLLLHMQQQEGLPGCGRGATAATLLRHTALWWRCRTVRGVTRCVC